MACKCSCAILLLTTAVLAFGLLATAALSAPTVSKTLKLTAVESTATCVVVERGSLRLVVKSGSRFIAVRRAPRYRVIKRAKSYCLLMPLVNVFVPGARVMARPTTQRRSPKPCAPPRNHGRAFTCLRGKYRVSLVVAPAGLAVYGAGIHKAWLKGHLDFSSNALIVDMKIGNDWGGATGNGSPWTATNTVNRQ
ncbi:MAG: hypothetical protein GX596_06670 [Propionibacterium sp.]|nr:hypothetical protein [Propionibacterium sp.]